MTKHSTLPPHTVLSRASGDTRFDLRQLYSLFSVSVKHLPSVAIELL